MIEDVSPLCRQDQCYQLIVSFDVTTRDSELPRPTSLVLGFGFQFQSLLTAERHICTYRSYLTDDSHGKYFKLKYLISVNDMNLLEP